MYVSMCVCQYVCMIANMFVSISVFLCMSVHGVIPVRVHSLVLVESSSTLDQFAVCVSCSESLQIRHASLDCLGRRHSALHVDQVT